MRRVETPSLAAAPAVVSSASVFSSTTNPPHNTSAENSAEDTFQSSAPRSELQRVGSFTAQVIAQATSVRSGRREPLFRVPRAPRRLGAGAAIGRWAEGQGTRRLRIALRPEHT